LSFDVGAVTFGDQIFTVLSLDAGSYSTGLLIYDFVADSTAFYTLSGTMATSVNLPMVLTDIGVADSYLILVAYQ
jgi:hypothetical protein